MKRVKWIALPLLLLFLVIGIGQIIQVAGSGGFAPVDIVVTSIFDENNTIIDNTSFVGKGFGTKLRLDVERDEPIPTGYNFAFWVVNGTVRQDLPVNHQFVITSKMEIIAVYHPMEPLKHAVLFMDSNGKLLDTQFVANGGTALDPSTRETNPITLPTKPGLTVATPKWKTLSEVDSLENINSSRVYVLQYEADTSQVFTLTVNNGLGTTTPTYDYNDVATVTADINNGVHPFSHWEENGHIVSTQLTYSFTMLSNRELTAVYAASAASNLPRVVLSNDLGIRLGYHSFLGQIYLPNNYELIEYGIIYHSSSVVLDLSTEGINKIQSNKRTANTNEYLVSIVNQPIISARAYITVKLDNTISTIYSNIYVSYNESFETISTWNSYPTSDSNRVFSGLDWTVKEVLLPSSPDDNDLFSTDSNINGTKVLRFRGANTAYMILDDYQDYISKISFDAKYYNASHSDSVMKVWKQIIGGEWVEVNEILLTDVYTNYNIRINSSNVRVKITVDGKTANLDNLRVQTIDRNLFHDLTFNNEGSTTIISVKDNRFVELLTPTKTGYSFEGWHANSELTSVFDNSLIKSSFTLYAKWVINQYTITFDSRGGSSVQSITQDYDTTVTEPSPPEREGFAFVYWYHNDEDTPYIFSKMPAENITLTAKWDSVSATIYTVTFNSNGGSSVATQEVAANDLVIKPADPTKGNDKFVNWYSDASFTQLYNFSSAVTSSMTLYAKWYTLSYSTGFESANPNKTSYAKSDTTIDGEVWELNEVLRGNLADDKKVGLFSLRGRIINASTPGTAWLKKSYENLTEISFMYANYGSLTTGRISLQIAFNVVKDNWTTIWEQSENQSTLLEQIVTIDYDSIEGLNFGDAVQIRFIFSSTTTNQDNSRLNLDEIKIYTDPNS